MVFSSFNLNFVARAFTLCKVTCRIFCRAQRSCATSRSCQWSALKPCLLPGRWKTSLTVSPFSLQANRANTRAEKVVVITVDGRTLVGKLLTHDQVTNIVLGDTIERIIRPADDPEPSSETSHGLYLVRGDNITMVGLVEEELDASIDWTKVRGEVIGSTKHV
jgi:U6 snRNA-associated Sm-like protein LSm8